MFRPLHIQVLRGKYRDINADIKAGRRPASDSRLYDLELKGQDNNLLFREYVDVLHTAGYFLYNPNALEFYQSVLDQEEDDGNSDEEFENRFFIA